MIFDSTSKYYAQILAETKIEIFDTATSKVLNTFNEKNVKFLKLSFSSTTEKVGKTTIKKVLIAGGTAKGEVFVYDIISGKQISKLTGEHNSNIVDLVFNNNGSLIYSGDRNGLVCGWYIDSQKKLGSFNTKQQNLTRMAMNSQSTVLATASTDIKLWDLSSMKLLSKLKGHTTDISLLKFTEDSNFLLSSSGDRNIHIWRSNVNTENNSNKNNNNEEFGILVNSLSILSIGSINKSKTEYIVLSKVSSNNLVFWTFNSNSNEKEPKKPQLTYKSQKEIQSSQLSSKREFIFTTTSNNNNNNKNNTVKFITGEFNDDKSVFLKQIKLISQEEETNEENGGSEEVENSKKIKFGSKSQPLASSVGDSNKSNQEQLNNGNLPMVNDVQKGESSSSSAKSGSVVNLIIQAIRSGDESLLDVSLQVPFHTLISTVPDLPSPYAYSLLSKLLVQLATSKTPAILPWIINIIKFHSNYLITIPNLQKELHILNTIIDDKLQIQSRITQLIGKLEFMEQKVKTTQQSNIDSTPKLVYIEKEQDENMDEEDDEEAFKLDYDEDDIEQNGDDQENDIDLEDDDDDLLNDLMDDDDLMDEDF